MSAKKIVTIDQFIRLTSPTGKLYLALKDGKRHNIPSLRTMLAKAGSDHLFTTVYKLGRILRANMNQKVVIENRKLKTGTFQLVPLKEVKSKTSAATGKQTGKKTAKPAKKTVNVEEAIEA